MQLQHLLLPCCKHIRLALLEVLYWGQRWLSFVSSQPTVAAAHRAHFVSARARRPVSRGVANVPCIAFLPGHVGGA